MEVASVTLRKSKTHKENKIAKSERSFAHLLYSFYLSKVVSRASVQFQHEKAVALVVTIYCFFLVNSN